MGYIGYAVIITIILSVVLIILDITKFALPKSKNMQLKIVVPEDLNYEELFDDVLNKYTTSWNIERVKTKDFGALFELTYRIQMNFGAEQKKFIDELRCRNGNLNINLILGGTEDKSWS